MFTGLIEVVGNVVQLERAGSAARLTIAATFPGDEVQLGDSIAINGVCLTVVSHGGGMYVFDVSPETLERTAFRRFKPGTTVNLERALRLSDRLGGHIVTGHVDCVATIAERREQSGNTVFTFRLPRDSARYVVAKGSVTIDGISLTVNSITGEGFSVNIIPHTAVSTTLQFRKPGDEVNIETDILGKYVERLLGGQKDAGGGLTLELLAKNGFL